MWTMMRATLCNGGWAIPGIERTAVEQEDLVVYYYPTKKSEVRKSVKNLHDIIRDGYTKNIRTVTMAIRVAEPQALLSMEEGYRWSLVDWF